MSNRYTTETLAAALELPKEVAYSLQTYLRHTQALRDTGEVVKKDGHKGKGATLFEVDPVHMAEVREKLGKL